MTYMRQTLMFLYKFDRIHVSLWYVYFGAQFFLLKEHRPIHLL